MSLINPQYLCHDCTCTTVVLLSFMRHRQLEIAFQTRNSVIPECDVIFRFSTWIICANCEDSSSFPRLSLRRAGVVGGGGACACVFFGSCWDAKTFGTLSDAAERSHFLPNCAPAWSRVQQRLPALLEDLMRIKLKLSCCKWAAIVLRGEDERRRAELTSFTWTGQPERKCERCII